MAASLLCFLVFLIPTAPADASLVSCSGEVGDECQFCDFAELIHNVIEWLATVFGVIVVLILIYAGLRLVVSTGSVEAKTTAKGLIATAIVGYILLLGAGLLVDSIMKVLLSNQNYGIWNSIQCLPQPQAQQGSRPTASGDSAAVLTPSQVAARVAAIQSSGALQNQISTAASQAGLTSEQEKLFRALISQESSNCTNKVGPPTNFGNAYGCGQMLLSTAQGLDPSATKDKLLNDDAYNLALSAQYFKQQLDAVNGDANSALASYNGGAAALQQSRDCPGVARWQCPWDSPGCWDPNTSQPNGNTSCTPNTGFDSYEQTRHYVENINNIASKI